MARVDFTTTDLLAKIGALTLENEWLRAELARLEAEAAAQTPEPPSE